ncbi:hypothetical protein LHJ74_21010 [Streptomyces sp. N2-109]|uniref:Uncharacterized protein n=1 Tax=Streptomyces gossypii TaxID=2883101 RepID=A0ABT2JY30_9ACTN|nr:hypothetical protein [Streptomyces gossypii]MCT2592354.1 hypothetical protein [Streptomyces gossypii]
MTDTDRMFTGLLDAGHGLSLEQLPSLVREQAARAGLGNALIYLADLQEDVLRPVTGRSPDAGSGTGEDAAELRIDDTRAGESFARPGATGGRRGQAGGRAGRRC